MNLQILIENTLYSASQIFMLPVLLIVMLLFLYSFYALGGFLLQSRQRRQQNAAAFDLLSSFKQQPSMTAIEIETLAFKRLEAPRIVTRVTPMLGLVATMIPMGPALKSLGSGDMAKVSDNLTVAFSAVIIALVAASVTYWIVNVRRRWYAEEIVMIEQERKAQKVQPIKNDLKEAAADLAQESA
ncbi:MAG: hypothetical protein RL217_1531 [Pseudomonadota bacterium]|jgi:biopolymer transport protein ExbB/TolQ